MSEAKPYDLPSHKYKKTVDKDLVIIERVYSLIVGAKG